MDRRELMAAMVGLGLAGIGGCARADDYADAPIPDLPEGLTARLAALVAGSGAVGGMVAASQHGRLAGFYAWGDARRSPKQPATPEHCSTSARTESSSPPSPCSSWSRPAR